MTPAERIAAIKARHAAAAPGPYTYSQQGQQIDAPAMRPGSQPGDTFMFAQIRGWGHLQYLNDDGSRGAAVQDANGELIAHSWEDIKWMLGYIASLEEQLERIPL